MVILILAVGNISSKINKASLSFYGKQPTVFVADDKNSSFWVKIRILKSYICLINLTLYQFLVSDEMNGDTNKFKKYL